MTTEKELGEALKRGDSTIEVELDLARKVIKIKTVRNGMWVLCVTAIGVAVVSGVVAISTAGTATVPSAFIATPAIATASGVLGMSTAISAIGIAMAGGGVQELTRAKVQQVYNSLRKKSNRSDNPLSASTIKHIHRVLKCALNVAVDEGIIKENPVRKIKIGKDICSDHLEVYTVEEIRALEKAVRGTDMELPVALLFDCVMRRGELLGLSYSDIDFDKKEVTIQHAWTETETNEPVLKDCKTESSYRKLIVSDHTMELLRRQRTIYLRNRMKYGEDFCNSNRVICKENGEPYRPKSFTRKWAKTLKKYGLRHIKLHGTRHSAISLLLSEGVPIQIAQQRAGHQDPKITLSVYSHVSKDKESLVADMLEDVLFSAVGE